MQTPKRNNVVLTRTKFNFQRRNPAIELAAVKESLKDFQKNVRIGKSINSQYRQPFQVNMDIERIPTKMASPTTGTNCIDSPKFHTDVAVKSPNSLLNEISNTLKAYSNKKHIENDIGETFKDGRIFLRNIENIINNYGTKPATKPKSTFNVDLDDLKEFKDKFHLSRTPVKRLRLVIQDGYTSDQHPSFARSSTPTSDYVEDVGEELYEKFKCRMEQPLQKLRITGSKLSHIDIVNGHLVSSKARRQIRYV